MSIRRSRNIIVSLGGQAELGANLQRRRAGSVIHSLVALWSDSETVSVALRSSLFAIDMLDDPEALAPKQHVLRKLAPTSKVGAMGLAPGRERAVTFALIVSEDGVDILEAAQGEFNSLENGARLA